MSNFLFHFSEDAHIQTFVPRPVRTPVHRPKGQEWLNGPLVWAIDAANSPLYLFPRDCPRIIMSRGSGASHSDIKKFWTDASKPLVAYVENGWVTEIQTMTLYRYAFERVGFIDLQDVGMHVTHNEVRPLKVDKIINLFDELENAGVEVKILPDLSELKNAWDSSLQVSGIRLRNAVNWDRKLFWLRPNE